MGSEMCIRDRRGAARARGPPGASAARVAADVWRAEGLDGLWARGVAAGCARALAYQGLRLGLFSPLRAALPGGDGLGAALAAGALTGALGSALCNPFDVAKARAKRRERPRELAPRAARALTPPRALRRYGSRAASGSTPTRPPRSSRARAPRARAACGAPRPSRSCAPAPRRPRSSPRTRWRNRSSRGACSAARRRRRPPRTRSRPCPPRSRTCWPPRRPTPSGRERSYTTRCARARRAAVDARVISPIASAARSQTPSAALAALVRGSGGGPAALFSGTVPAFCRLLPMALFVLPLMEQLRLLLGCDVLR